MAKKSKKYAAAEKAIPEGEVAPIEAMKVVKEISTANFDETVTADFRLGIDTRQADQQLRGTVSLPNGSGKTVCVAVFAEGEAARAAEEAGADIVGTDELMAQIQAGEFNFDAAVATPDQMGKVGRLGKILGPRGLMPNPKLGTVTNDVAKAINELKGGRVEYRADRYGIAHVVLGIVVDKHCGKVRHLNRQLVGDDYNLFLAVVRAQLALEFNLRSAQAMDKYVVKGYVVVGAKSAYLRARLVQSLT